MVEVLARKQKMKKGGGVRVDKERTYAAPLTFS